MKGKFKGLFILGLALSTFAVGGISANAAPGQNGNNTSTDHRGSYDNYPPTISYDVVMKEAVADGSRQGENGTEAGTIGKNDYAWDFSVVLSENSTTPVIVSGDDVIKSVYYADYGWLTGLQTTDIVGKDFSTIRPLEKIKLSLSGNIAKYFDVEYSVYSRGIGWQTACNGQEAGTKGVPVEAVKAQLVRNNVPIGSGATQPDLPIIEENTNKPLYRVYNPVTTEHLYTKDVHEYDTLATETLNKKGWNREGVAWMTPATGADVYRLFNRHTGEHFYTKDVNEKNTLVKRGWKYEGVAFYSEDKSTAVPIYRLYNSKAPQVGSHHYTKDLNEKDTLVKRGWKFEGVAFYGADI